MSRASPLVGSECRREGDDEMCVMARTRNEGWLEARKGKMEAGPKQAKRCEAKGSRSRYGVCWMVRMANTMERRVCQSGGRGERQGQKAMETAKASAKAKERGAKRKPEGGSLNGFSL
ncbi:hypothetical protein PHSY_001669 [Pseudozyma hubeiensis SY62]|uniref:Uncharacterized protein n=1 Tax=Pseudozyma hubeiensis (strain SY62) TaxID=1305764 RepID=R9P7K7_PSEHS|nr:hypothetical protein PHSY_001669 [Pseudozyma hubeiensis SY62]GAC94100.1 hypothetical protein PHSY_001669 [Pseudozyma hubeiensis SY62]